MDANGRLCPGTLALNIIIQQGAIHVVDASVAAALRLRDEHRPAEEFMKRVATLENAIQATYETLLRTRDQLVCSTLENRGPPSPDRLSGDLFQVYF